MESFDFDSLDTVTAANQGVDVEILHPVTEEPTGLIITVCGEDSDRYADETKKQQKKKLHDAMIKGKRSGKFDLDVKEEDTINLLVAVTLGWKTKTGSPVALGGREMPFSPENVAEVYRKYPVVKRQVDKAVHNISLFTKS